MAINPTAPLTPISPAAPPGSQPHSVVLQTVARAALANVTQASGESAVAQTARGPRDGVELADKAGDRDAGRAVIAAAEHDGGGSGAFATQSPPAETRLMRAVRMAATEAVSKQAGLARLMADVSAVLDRPETPLEVRSAGEALLARLPRAVEMSTPRGLRTAVRRSGVFLEARLARSAPPASESFVIGTQTDLKAALLVFKGALSDWLARATPTPAPPPLVEMLSRPPSGPVVSHLFPEAQPGESEAEASSAQAPLAGTPTSGDDAVEPRFAAFIAPSKAAPLAQPAAPLSPGLGLLSLAEEPPGADDRSTSFPLAVRGYGGAFLEPDKPNTPPPPFADGPMAGQRPTPSQLPANTTAEGIVRRLLKGVSGALARQTLMQIASLREVHDSDTREARTQPARLNLDLPFMTPQGVAVAQFEITKDGGGAATGSAERTSRVRFSIDIEPLGPVHAIVILTGKQTRVSLWAERYETIARLRADEESLGAALRQAELTPDIAIHSGPAPVKDASALGHFVDQAS